MLRKAVASKFLNGAAALLLVLMFPAVTSAETSDGFSLGGGMSTTMAGATTWLPSAASAVQGIPQQPVLTNAGSANTGEQDGAAQIEQLQGGAAQNLSNEFQVFLSRSVGRVLPMYGYNLFNRPPSTFAPVNDIPVTQDYVIGPGDEIVLAGWGQVDIDLRVVVDRNGAINLPKVGTVNVAGIKYQNLESYLKNEIGNVFRNFKLSVTLGKLRSLQVFVVGQAQRPGVYTVSSLSTLVNTLFMSGGPSPNGTMRHIQLKRGGKVVTELDVYDLLINGDKSRDVALLSGDVIYIPPIGHLAAISGSVKNPAIYELKDGTTSLASLLELSGGLTTTAAGQKVLLERISNRTVRQVEEFQLDSQGMSRPIKDGDLVQVSSIDARFDNAVTLRGSVATPGRYPWKEGMRVSDLIPNTDALIAPEYWMRQNNAFRVDPSNEGELRTQIKRNQNEINWDYAVIERLNKEEMSTALLPFNLGKAVGGKDDENNILLQPGDVITIFSKDDIKVPVAKRSVYVRLEGEFNRAGVYKALPGETLRQLVARVGGLTPNAYLFAAELEREPVRAMQQKKIDEMADRMADDIERSFSAKSQSALSAEDVAAARTQAEGQRALLAHMRQTKASGRIVLDMTPEKSQLSDLPDIALEDGDRFVVPARLSTVGVMGMVYNENTYIYRPGKRVSDYLNQAGGPTRDADESRIYVVRADGSVVGAQSGGSFFGGFGGGVLMPGDTVVVPERLERFSLTKELKDWAEIFYKFALGVGGIKMLRL